MDLSVVVPTLNGRAELEAALSAIDEHVPAAEVVVVNGPSADGTTGMVRDRDDVDLLLEVSDRNVNVARNAGLAAATGDVVAIVSYNRQVEASWYDAVERAVDAGAEVVTGPTHRTLRAGMTTEDEESRTIAGRRVTYFNPDNVAFRRGVIEDLDGFDECLETGGARDAAHRLAGLDRSVTWHAEVSVRGEYRADGGQAETDWREKYRSLTYRLFKNYGLRPTVFRRTATHAARDAAAGVREVLGGDRRPTQWFGNTRDVLVGTLGGTKDGVAARARDRSRRRNPCGISARPDRAVQEYDWRE